MIRSTSSVVALVTLLFVALTVPSAVAIDGPLANANVSFGQWRQPLDRFPINSPAGSNEHQLIPHTATIRAGGAVNFIISGLHQPIVYAAGTQSTDIDTTLTVLTTGVPNNVPLIDDPNGRLYRGLDPSRLIYVTTVTGTLPVRDRVEVVQFPNPGRYLVICGVHPHFVNDDMFGFVNVLP